ncbi:MAG: alkaline phosphatase, partial [Spongiibacteraceae bacterium]
DIAWQLVNFESLLEARMPGVDIDGIDVVMGGGRRAFLPKQKNFNSSDADSAIEGTRSDGQDLTANWKKHYPSGHYLIDKQGFDQLDISTEHNVLALFNSSHMHYEADRHRDLGGEPSLSEMTSKAISILQKNENGFLLIVEAGRIDHGHHAGNAQAALNETIELSNAVAKANELTSDEDSLIIVTADHSHVFTMAGYPRRGNPILGKVIPTGQRHAAKALDGLPYTTLGYANGQGFASTGQQTDADTRYHRATASGRRDLRRIDTLSPGFHQEALVPLSIETHSGEDVAVYARGPGAALVSGSNEQNSLFHVMEYAADLLGHANFAQSARAKK